MKDGVSGGSSFSGGDWKVGDALWGAGWEVGCGGSVGVAAGSGSVSAGVSTSSPFSLSLMSREKVKVTVE